MLDAYDLLILRCPSAIAALTDLYKYLNLAFITHLVATKSDWIYRVNAPQDLKMTLYKQSVKKTAGLRWDSC